MDTIKIVNLFSIVSGFMWLFVFICIYIKATKKSKYFLYWIISMLFYISYLSTNFICGNYLIPDQSLIGITLLGISYLFIILGIEFFVPIRGRKIFNIMFIVVLAIIIGVMLIGYDYILLFLVYIGAYFVHIGLELFRTKKSHNYVCGSFFLLWGIFNFLCHILLNLYDFDVYLYIANRLLFIFSNGILIISFILKKYKDFEFDMENIVSIFEASSVGLELYNADEELIVTNPICLKMFEVDAKEDILGVNVFEKYKMAKRSLEQIRKGHDVSFRMEFDFQYDRREIHSNYEMKDKKYLEVRMNILGTDRLKPEGYFVQVQDISEHIFSSHQLEERLKLAVKSANLYEWDWYIRSNDLYIDPRMAISLGYDPNHFNGNGDILNNYINQEDLPKINNKLEEHYRQESEMYICEWRIRHVEGHDVWHMGMGAVIEREPNGTPIRMVGMIQSIEKIKESEIKLQRSEQRYRSLFETMLNGYMRMEKIYDDQGKVIDYLCVETNSSLQEIVGYKDAIEGKTLKEIIKTETYWVDLLDKMGCMNEKNRVEQYSMSLGKILEVVLHPFGEHQIILIIRDVTNERNLENMVRQTEKLSAIGQLVGGIAHDFNNQLMAIGGAISIVKTKCPAGECRKYINYIEKCSNNSASLVNHLLTFSRESDYEMVSINIHEIINSVVEILERSIDKKIKVNTSLKAEQYMVFGDESQIQNTLLNIGLNARDAMGNGGKLVFRTYNCSEDCNEVDQVGKPHIVIVVSDTGVGMSDEVKKRIFEPFFTTKGIGKGTGLGLAMVFGIIKKHGGCISVNSVINVGTDFTVKLPVMNEIAGSTVQEKEGLIKGVEKIMIVDDETMLQELLKEMLEMLGYEVITFVDGYQALSYYRENWRDIHLVLLDLVMPKLSGKELFEGLYAINPLIKAAFLTGYGLENMDESIRSRINGFINKPINMEELSIKMREMLEQ